MGRLSGLTQMTRTGQRRVETAQIEVVKMMGGE
jgi:hypothetical protein